MCIPENEASQNCLGPVAFIYEFYQTQRKKYNLSLIFWNKKFQQQEVSENGKSFISGNDGLGYLKLSSEWEKLKKKKKLNEIF